MTIDQPNRMASFFYVMFSQGIKVRDTVDSRVTIMTERCIISGRF